LLLRQKLRVRCKPKLKIKETIQKLNLMEVNKIVNTHYTLIFIRDNQVRRKENLSTWQKINKRRDKRMIKEKAFQFEIAINFVLIMGLNCK